MTLEGAGRWQNVGTLEVHLLYYQSIQKVIWEASSAPAVLPWEARPPVHLFWKDCFVTCQAASLAESGLVDYH